VSDSITCPNCKTEIPLTEAISHEVEERLRAEFDVERERLVEEHVQHLADRDAEIEGAIAKARKEEVTAAEARATEQVSVQLRDLQSRAEEQEKLRVAAEERELTLRREKRKLETDKNALQLQMERQLDEERESIAAGAKEQADEHWRMQLRERDLQIEQMNSRIDDLQAAADQKRSGLQGEVLEREIEDVLSEQFPTDGIEPVKSGKRGADVVQRVRSGRGECGKLLWESKNHKHWSDGWIDKLRSDQQGEKADVAIIVTAALPEGVEHIDFIRGVWVCDFASVLPLAIALRQQLDAVMQSRIIDTNRSRVADDLYEYICGQEVQHYITNLVVSTVAQKRELDSERLSAERTFNRREKQILTQQSALAAFYGGLQGIAGGALQPVAELEAPPRDDEPGPLALAS
jgi:hypothetical protein